MKRLRFLMKKMWMLIIMFSMFFVSCDFFSDGDSKSDDRVTISAIKLTSSDVKVQVGSITYIGYTVVPSGTEIEPEWSYDSSIIDIEKQSNGAVIKGLKEGETSLTVTYQKRSATAIVKVQGFADTYVDTTDPYIYSNTTTIQTSPGITEKVFVSLYGGDIGDIDGYTWTIDNSSVASIQPTGQYCFITAKDSGYARIKVTHQKSAYPYYMGVYVFADASNVTYITTDNNILTMNKDDDEKIISVSLVNGKDTSLDSNFSWEIINQDSDVAPVSLQYNENKAVIKPLESGSCTIRITHPDAVYPLDILCRVITVVKNVYIQPDKTYITLDGEAEQTITSTLENIDISNYSIDDYSYSLEDYTVAEIAASVGNQVFLKGKANGSTKLIISHPKAPYSREVLLIVTGQITNAIDASGYITTSQNYIRTKVGAEITKISVSLKGGTDGDESGFIWSVKQVPDDGASDVINLETTNGITESSRAVNATYVYGNAYITPKTEGTAVISISHPKIVYPTEILVKVLPEDAILEEPLYFTGEGILRMLNGDSADYTVCLRGKNKTDSDDSEILWSSDDDRISIVSAGNTVNVTAPAYGTGNTISHITARHNKADTDKTVLVLTADTEEELKNMKALYSDKLYYNFGVNDEVYVMCNHVGFDKEPEGDDEEITKYDFSLFKWEVSDPSVISVEKNASYPLNCTVKGLKSGKAILKGSIVDDGTTYSCEFTMTVYPEGTVQTEPEIYFTTTQNVITLSGKEKTANVSVTPVRLPASEYSNITWEVEGEDIIDVISNGSSATITALTEGETVINVSHPDSQNTLKIYVRVGSEYVIPETEPIIYISAQDVLTMLRDDPIQKLQAVLVNCAENATGGFSFSIDNENVATIYAQYDNGIAYIKPVSSGQAEITITNSKTELSKKVLVIVGNSAEELAGFTYLSTTTNVVSIGEGNSKSISVSVKNSENIIIDGFTWSSGNPEIVDIVPGGANAVLKGNKVGTAIVSVKNKACKYPLEIIVQVVDPIAAATNPYIQLTSSVMTLTCGNTYTSITAELVGGTDSDKSSFNWSSNDSKIAIVYGQNEVGKVKALTAGTTYINVSHPKAAYPAQVLVVCDEVKESECSISVPNSIIAMKPTDSTQTITATLVNGSANDKYNFSWSLDVYDIIDFQYSANVCTITPKQTGSVTITVSHPKAAYPQQIIVNVQQYSTFSFPDESMTFTQGDVKFISMQVPNTNVTTHVEYDVENSAICSITGTKTTAQITAVGSGTTIVKARLIASSTGVEQASSEMMIYVKEKDVDVVYITSSSTINTVNKGKSQTLSASLVGAGVETNDQYNLRWTTSDSDIVQVTGISSDGYVYGQSIYITALKSGEAVITCSHEKAASSLQFYVVVPGSAEKVVSLNKSYMTLVKGSSGSSLKVDIENKESSNDYNNIIWSCESSKIGTEVCRIMGKPGPTVTIYPLAVGEATVMAQLPGSSSVAKCTVLVEAGKSLVFETNTRKVQPMHSVTVKYTVSPPDAVLTWQMAQMEDFFSYHDNGCDSQGNGSVEIIGNSQNLIGNGTLVCITDGGAKAQCTVNVAWNYSFSVKGKTDFTIEPDETATIEYEVNPVDADITISSAELDSGVFTYTKTDNGNGTGIIVIKPLKEYASSSTIKVIATNPNDGNKVIGTKTLTAKFLYAKLTPVITFVKSSGKFSKYSSASKTFLLGDGEDFTLNVKIAENNSSGIVKSVEYKNVNKNSYTCQINSATDIAGNYIFTSNIADQIEKGYWVTEACRPQYKNGQTYDILDWKTSMQWWFYGYEVHSSRHYGSLALYSATYSMIGKCGGTSLSYDEVKEKDNTIKFVKFWWGGQSAKDHNDWNDSAKESPYTGNYFVQKKDSSLNGFYKENEFYKIGYWWCPGTQGTSANDTSDGDRFYKVIYNPDYNTNTEYHVDIRPHIMTENVTAKYGYSISTNCEKEETIGEIKVTLSHNGSDEIHTYPVILQVRNCEKSLVKTTE